MLALVSMIIVSQEFDTYQSSVNSLQQGDYDRFSENMVVNNLYFIFHNSSLNQYAINLTNYGISLVITRIYINSSAQPGCYPAPCILDPSNGGINKFQWSDAFVSAGEAYHFVTFWLPAKVELPPITGANTILISTSRGRVFAAQWTLPVLGSSAQGQGWGGTALNIGPLVIKYETVLATYDMNATGPPLPDPGGWVFPGCCNNYIIIYLKVANQADTPVYITTQSLLQVQQYGATGAPTDFWLVAPMDSNLCSNTFAKNPLNSNLWCQAGGAYLGGNTYPSGKTVIPYSGAGTSNEYAVPASKKGNMVCCGRPIYLLFGASNPGGTAGVVLTPNGALFFTYLDLIFQWNINGSGYYTYGVNLPFISICSGSGPYSQNCPP